jgi:hypothetical protein
VARGASVTLEKNDPETSAHFCSLYSIRLLSRVGVCARLIRRVLDWMTGFINSLYIHTARDYRQYSANAILHILEFTVAHALGFWVFISRVLATYLQQSHCHFKSHMKSSSHSLTPFLPLYCSCQFRRLDSVQILCSQAHIPAGWRLETRHFTSRLLFYSAKHFLITTLHWPRRKQPVILRRCVYWSFA